MDRNSSFPKTLARCINDNSKSMLHQEPNDVRGGGGPREFRTTNWDQIRAAGTSGAIGMSALEAVCRNYWFPLYAFVRRQGYDPSRAEDLTQGFFESLLSSGGIEQASPDRGRFRTFLMASLKNYLANEWDRDHRQKRGGGREFIWWDGLEPEERFAMEPILDAHSEKVFDRQWAEALIANVMKRLRNEVEFDDHAATRFDRLKVFLIQPDAAPPYSEIGAELHLGENAVKSAIFRLRRRFAVLIRDEISKTVRQPVEVEEELRYLLAASVA